MIDVNCELRSSPTPLSYNPTFFRLGVTSKCFHGIPSPIQHVKYLVQSGVDRNSRRRRRRSSCFAFNKKLNPSGQGVLSKEEGKGIQ